MENDIRDALLALHAAIPRGDGTAILTHTARLDELLALHRAALHPQLVHFLERRSYAKALAWVGGESPPAGSCGGSRPKG